MMEEEEEDSMTYVQRSGGQLLLLLLAGVGVGISLYLTAVHYQNAPLICSSSGLVDCARVLSSPYSVVAGTSVPISVPGLAWCLAIGALALARLRARAAPRWLNMAQLLWSLVGVLSALYLVYVEIVLLHTLCAWCTVLHVIILLVLLVTLVQFQQGVPAAKDDSIEEENPAEPGPHASR
jgi:uncharacterized membrane protein